MDQFFEQAASFLKEYGGVIMGTLISFFMALLRTAKVHGKVDWIEAAMCSGFVLGIGSALEFFGLPQALATLVGAFVGYMGTHKVSQFISNKTNFEDNNK